MPRRESPGRRLWIVALVVVIVAVVFAAVATSAIAATNSSGVIQSAIDDVQAFWATKLPAVYGMEYKPIPQNRLFPYSENAETKRARNRDGSARPEPTYACDPRAQQRMTGVDTPAVTCRPTGVAQPGSAPALGASRVERCAQPAITCGSAILC